MVVYLSQSQFVGGGISHYDSCCCHHCNSLHHPHNHLSHMIATHSCAYLSSLCSRAILIYLFFPCLIAPGAKAAYMSRQEEDGDMRRFCKKAHVSTDGTGNHSKAQIKPVITGKFKS